MRTKCRFVFFQPSFKGKNIYQYPEVSAVQVFSKLSQNKARPIYNFATTGSSTIRPEMAEENTEYIHIEFLKSQDRNLPYDVEKAGPAKALGTSNIGIPTTISIHKDTGIISAQTLNMSGAVGINTALNYMSAVTKTAQIGCLPILNKAALEDILAGKPKKLEIIAAEPLLLSSIEDKDEESFLKPMIEMQDRMDAAQLALTFTADKDALLNRNSVISMVKEAMPFLGRRKIKKLRIFDEDLGPLDFIGAQQDFDQEVEMENHQLKLNFSRKIHAIEEGFKQNLGYLKEYKMAA